MTNRSAILAAAITGLAIGSVNAAFAEPSHAIAMHGAPAMPADMAAFPYVNPDAPKGGSIKYCVLGTFDNLNPFILNSMRTTARGMIDAVYGNFVFQPLMERSKDEAFTMYPLLAKSIETDSERTWIEFTLDPAAKWSDGTPVTPDDVIFSYDTYQAKGRPPYASRKDRIASIEKTAPDKVKFTFNEKSNREYPLIIALTPIIPKHATNAETFDQTTLAPMVGSGPYIVKAVAPGQSITFERNKDYWAKDLPTQRGMFNYDTVTIDYYRNDQSLFEAFKAGQCDTYAESDPGKWLSAYDFPAVTSGAIIKSEFTNALPTPMMGFVLNTRRATFADRNVREGLSMLYDFEWANKNLYLDQFRRIGSYWENSELSALGRPASDGEKALLANHMDKVTPSVMDGSYVPPQSDGSGRDRIILSAALDAFAKAGYKLADGKLVGADGKQLAFEISITSAEQEKMALALQRNAEKIGIAIAVRTVDDAQIQTMKQTFDYDVIITSIGFSGSLSPGIEQYSRWGAKSRDEEGSFNYAGVADPAIDAMIDALTNARERTDFVDAVRALDRLLISGHYMMPMQYKATEWIAHSAKIKHPEKTSIYGAQLFTWWAE